MKYLFLLFNTLFLFVLFMSSSSCDTSGNCDCSKSRIVVMYESLNFYHQLSDCPDGLPCYPFSETSNWEVVQSVGNSTKYFGFYLNTINIPAVMGFYGCHILDSESIFEIQRQGYCNGNDNMPLDFSINCFDKFVVTPPPCGKVKYVNRKELLCFCLN